MESDGTYMSDHQLFFLSDSYPRLQQTIGKVEEDMSVRAKDKNRRVLASHGRLLI